MDNKFVGLFFVWITILARFVFIIVQNINDYEYDVYYICKKYKLKSIFKVL